MGHALLPPALRLIGARALGASTPTSLADRRESQHAGAGYRVLHGIMLKTRQQDAMGERFFGFQLTEAGLERGNHARLASSWGALDKRNVGCVQRNVECLLLLWGRLTAERS